MGNKYYTPTIDEFYVGFEFEWYDEDDKTWNKTIIKTQSELYNWIAYDDINKRVKYLDKEDIESLGFIYTWLEKGVYSFEKSNYILTWFENTTHIKLNYKTGYQLFDGVVKNKSELVKVLKMIGIND